MWNLVLQSFDGPSLNIKYHKESKRIGKFLDSKDAQHKIQLILEDAENKGYNVVDNCYFAKDHSEAFALLLTLTGVPLYEVNKEG